MTIYWLNLSHGIKERTEKYVEEIGHAKKQPLNLLN